MNLLRLSLVPAISYSTINSNDIESMTVIKDAAAASLYGSRAANVLL
ncbi:TonB-dependent receptor plug domain-containing protein [Bacteroides fragilis]|nr:TonB-dependent receptor plug domain-containing protein [Bacteroides fragilis]